jgi:hypothetical protein
MRLGPTRGQAGVVHDHGSAHSHDHPHDHAGAAEVLPDPSGPGSVMVDLGGEIGVAVVATPASLDGEEIEIRPEPGVWTGHHVAVRARPLPDGTMYAAFFEGLVAGSYRVRIRFSPPGALELPLEVRGGSVASIAWPD